jgi:hypothetical protein
VGKITGQCDGGWSVIFDGYEADGVQDTADQDIKVVSVPEIAKKEGILRMCVCMYVCVYGSGYKSRELPGNCKKKGACMYVCMYVCMYGSGYISSERAGNCK